MLTDLREKSQSFLIYILFGILIIVFIFFFGPQAEGCQPGQPQSRSLSGWAAKVNGEEVSIREVEISVRRQALIQQDSADDAESLARLRRETVQQVIDQALLEQQARRMGLAIGEKALSQYIISKENPDYPLFTDREGNFIPKNYRDQLTQLLRATPEAYRRAKRREVLVNRYIRFLSQQVAVSDAELKSAYDLATRTWNIEFLKFAATDYAKTVAEPTPEDVATASKARAKDIEAYYKKNAAKYNREAEFKISRVLIRRPTDKKDTKGLAEAKKKATDALAKAKGEGADFAAVAKELSQGYYGKDGGDMGWQGKKNTSPDDFAVYSKLKAGDISPLQDTSIGFWFVKATDIKPAVKKPLADVTTEIATSLLKTEGQKAAARADAEAALNTLKSTGALAAPAAEGAVPTTSVQSTGPVRENRAVWDLFPGLGRSEVLARKLNGLNKKSPIVGELLEVGDALVVAKLKERVDPDAKKYAEAKGDLSDRMRAERSRQLFGNWQAIVFGPTSQRETFRKFSGGSMLGGLANKASIEINQEAFPVPSKTATPPGQPGR